jgi:hypothetical protein
MRSLGGETARRFAIGARVEKKLAGHLSKGTSNSSTLCVPNYAGSE